MSLSQRPRALPFALLLVTDEAAARRAGRSVLETVERALGVDGAHRVAVLLRDKERPVERVREAARRLLPVVARAGASLLVHTHVSLAAELGLRGAQVAAGVDLYAARGWLDGGALLGASRHRGDPLDDEALGPADYVVLAPVFRPTSKPDDGRPPLGLEELRAACSRSARPVVALGGVQPRDARACLDAGAAAIAVLGGVMGAADPAAALAAYLASVEGGVTGSNAA